jgi:hypothetical protein
MFAPPRDAGPSDRLMIDARRADRKGGARMPCAGA